MLCIFQGDAILIILLGKTNSGKTTIQEILETHYGMKRIVTCTTRPMRDGEIDGKTYHFITEQEFYKRIAEHKFAEYRCYNSVQGAWYYGSLKSSYRTKNGVIISNPYGFREIKNTLKKYKEQPFSVYLRVSEYAILKRSNNRGDDMNEIVRRIKSDRKDFADLENQVDYCIDTDGNCPEVIAKQIYETYLKWRNKNEE